MPEPPPPMINPGFVRTMAAYNAEMNHRLYAAAARLPDAARRAGEGAFWSSIHGTFNHILWADRLWLSRFEQRAPPPTPMAASAEMIEAFEALVAAREELDLAITTWAGGVTEAWLGGMVTWHSAVMGREMTAPRSLLTVHMFNHQTHHRGQAHALLTRAGETTGDTDMPFVLPPEVVLAAMSG